MKDKTLHRIAYHEAGHAIACIEMGLRFKHVTIIENEQNNTLGHVMLSKFKFNPDYDDSIKSRIKLEKYIMAALAGPVAEKKFTGKLNAIIAQNDFEMSFKVATNFFGSIDVVSLYMQYMMAYTESFFTYNIDGEKTDTHIWESVILIAEALLKDKILKYKEVIQIISQ